MHKLVLILKSLIITVGIMLLFFVGATTILMIITGIIENIKGVDNLEPLENEHEIHH